jgi:hypothetical protein
MHAMATRRDRQIRETQEFREEEAEAMQQARIETRRRTTNLTPTDQEMTLGDILGTPS